MSHFTVTIALPGTLPNEKGALQDALEAVLAPYDENRETPRYVAYTREALIARERKHMEKYRDGTYADFLVLGEQGYRDKHHLHDGRNEGHMDYLTGRGEDGGFPARLTWTDEQFYAEGIILDYAPKDIGANGEVYSTYNPKSQWDWWVVGGRWGGYWTLKESGEQGALSTDPSVFGMAEETAAELSTDCARVRDIGPETLKPTFAFIALDGQWHESGDMGWWGIVTDEKDRGDWNKQYSGWISTLPDDTWLVNVDAHM